jgi:hypothetical protein
MPFRWDIIEVSEEDLSAVDGGELQIEDFKITAIENWRIEEPDKTVDLRPVPSGTIERIDEPTKEPKVVDGKTSLGLPNGGKKFNQAVTLIIVVILGVGFLTVVIKDVFYGNLDFQTYMVGVTSFLAGIGIGYFNKSSKD